jgi:hypothetical protein
MTQATPLARFGLVGYLPSECQNERLHGAFASHAGASWVQPSLGRSSLNSVICNGLGIMRACLETQKLEQLEARMDEIAHQLARDRTNVARERTSTDEAQRLTN